MSREISNKWFSIESSEALTIDDLADREEFAKIVGVELPDGKSADALDELEGLFDDTVTSGQEIDVVSWVKSIRKP